MKKIDLACIIDDDPVFVFGAQKIMELGNICKNFMIFSDGEEALNGLKAIISSKEVLPDFILLDLNMSKMDGWEFLDEFIKIPIHNQITIFITTGSTDPIDIAKAKTYTQVSNYMVKPISIKSLKERILKTDN
ncbi:response regulator [Christiangramia fulva]|uniref:Response regulator n=1 Tax=Christiangramia fulva TaxID=2126553 RepID=A0A2R3Z756_9FLAO|nr:response regulator [Christiangramia fulva]AVR46117.1 response regulator [Christiangramia fulva]